MLRRLGLRLAGPITISAALAVAFLWPAAPWWRRSTVATVVDEWSVEDGADVRHYVALLFEDRRGEEHRVELEVTSAGRTWVGEGDGVAITYDARYPAQARVRSQVDP